MSDTQEIRALDNGVFQYTVFMEGTERCPIFTGHKYCTLFLYDLYGICSRAQSSNKLFADEVYKGSQDITQFKQLVT